MASTVLTDRKVNWNQVFFFSEVAECGSLKIAAEKLKLSPPTLSEHIAQLERDLGLSLFHRRVRKITLTAEGSRMFMRAKEMFEAGERFLQVVSPVPLDTRPIAIALVASPLTQTAYNLIGEYMRDSTGLNVKVIHSTHEKLEEDVVQTKCDFGFSNRKPTHRGVSSRIVSSLELGFYVAKKFADDSLSRLLSRLPLLVCNGEPETPTLAQKVLRDRNLSPSSIVNADFPGALTNLCQKGLGVGVFAAAFVDEINRENKSQLYAVRGAPEIKDTLHALWAKDAENSEAIRKLKQILS